MPQTRSSPLRLPPAFRKPRGGAQGRRELKRLLRDHALHTVCEEARCPNIGECFSSGTATFMILGDTCTRRCHFCSVATGRPRAVDPGEPDRLANAAAALDLKHVVLTSVDRDDLDDAGANHWAACIRAVKTRLPHAEVEVLTPDFKGQRNLIDVVLDAAPDVFNHNIETVERIYRKVRPQSRWNVTSDLLRYVAGSGHPAVKSGLMVGLGETDDEVLSTLDHLRELGVHIATVGQYLRPSLAHWEVSRYVDDDSYARFLAHGDEIGFSHIFAGAFVRSSYRAASAAAAHSKRSKKTSSASPLPVLQDRLQE